MPLMSAFNKLALGSSGPRNTGINPRATMPPLNSPGGGSGNPAADFQNYMQRTTGGGSNNPAADIAKWRASGGGGGNMSPSGGPLSSLVKSIGRQGGGLDMSTRGRLGLPNIGLKSFRMPSMGLGGASPSLGSTPPPQTVTRSFKPSAFNMNRRLGQGRGIY